MRTIRVYVTTGRVGCKQQTEFEVEDGATEDEIDEMAREAMLSLIEWSWDEKTGD